MSRPNEISTLTSLRGVAALTVLLFHADTGFRGYLAVDLFFLLSGFILTHVYSDVVLTRQSYGFFLKARLARIYPVHLLMLIFLLPMLDSRPDFSYSGLFTSVLLLQAPWHSMCWNYASWSISAEWHSYLLFPFLVVNFRLNSRRSLCITLILCALVVGITDYVNSSGNISNTPAVLLRCLPEFIAGIVLYFLYQRGCMPKWIGHDMTFWSTAVILVLLEWLRAPDGIMVCLLGLILVTSAINQERPFRLLNCRPLAYLGYISYSLYMVQMVITIILLLFLEIPKESTLYKVLFISLCFLSAAIISPTIEYPARNWFRRISWGPLGNFRQ